MEIFKLSPFFLTSLWFLFFFCHGIESPQYTVIHSEIDLEIRLYKESWWMSAPVQGISFEKATKEGFHRLYRYIHGSNTNSSKLAMTAPILTSITLEAKQPLEYTVSFYLSSKFHGAPPRPLPDLSVELGRWESLCVVVRKFSGFAGDDNITKEVANLMTSLAQTNSTALLEDKNAYTIAQYNSSSHLVGRLNEVWMRIAGSSTEGC
ncbi:hypothetical protein MRB53_031606 [Persea americana]|uniref:Uncharacterized protein n=1 Tax=Persea americana TaxID=3435 RepID=A0ACC2KPV8_PERAE|nr:hypothetical protein MRB53_031606 [Persea americana]